jgi:hypothetical protein
VNLVQSLDIDAGSLCFLFPFLYNIVHYLVYFAVAGPREAGCEGKMHLRTPRVGGSGPGVVWDSSHVLPAVAGGRCLLPTKTSLWRKMLFRLSFSFARTSLQVLVTRLTNPLSLLVLDAAFLSSVCLACVILTLVSFRGHMKSPAVHTVDVSCICHKF